ncbi:MAG: DsrE family protein [Betaproteobacteria bacterium]|nr:DsrE family protein [Betaproteobacteria bacterium]
MAHQTVLKSLILSAAFLGTLAGGSPAMAAPSARKIHAIHVQIPVHLKQANVVFNMDHPAFFGDMPVGMKYMHLLALRMKQTGTKGRIIGVFHGKAAFMTLNDRAYDAYRGVTTGNPYKGLIANLQHQGVQIEECAVSMKGHGWGNADLLPGVRVNAGAVGRIIQLVQRGYVQIQP